MRPMQGKIGGHKGWITMKNGLKNMEKASRTDKGRETKDEEKGMPPTLATARADD